MTSPVQGMSGAQFRVALDQLHSAIGTVTAEKAKIDAAMGVIGSAFTTVDGAWDGPASDSFMALAGWFNTSSTALSTLLGDMISRLTTAYWMYHNAEVDNVSNAT